MSSTMIRTMFGLSAPVALEQIKSEAMATEAVVLSKKCLRFILQSLSSFSAGLFLRLEKSGSVAYCVSVLPI
jgi:hypothetical protein